MTHRLWGKLVSVFLAVLMPAVLLNAASPVAVMHARVSVLVNGVTTPDSSVIFTGDRIATTADSAANLVLDGSSITLAPETSLVYQNAGFQLETGLAAVATNRRLAAHAGAITVTPAALVDTHYALARLNKMIFVTATTGAVQVDDNGKQVLVAAGKTMSFQDQNDPQTNNPGKNNQKSAGAIRPGGTSSFGPIMAGLGISTGLALLVSSPLAVAPALTVRPAGSNPASN